MSGMPCVLCAPQKARLELETLAPRNATDPNFTRDRDFTHNHAEMTYRDSAIPMRPKFGVLLL